MSWVIGLLVAGYLFLRHYEDIRPALPRWWTDHDDP